MLYNRYCSNRIQATNSPSIRISPFWCYVCDRVFPSRQALLNSKNGATEPRRVPTRADQPQIILCRRHVQPVVPRAENDATSNPSGRGVPPVAAASGPAGSGTLTIVKLEPAEEEVVAVTRKLLEAFRENNSVSVVEASPEGTGMDPNVQAPRENNDGNETDSEDEREELYLEIRL